MCQSNQIFFFLSIDNFLRRFYPTSLISPFGIIAKEDFCTPSPPPPPSSKILQKIGKNSYDIHKPSRVRGNQNLSFSIVKSSKKWWSYLKILTLRKIFRKKWKLLRIIWNVEKIEKIENLFFWVIKCQNF